ncbi:MAG: hypothetical protein ACRDZX_01800 [Acidimicrobiales bacterium]
MPSAPPPPTPGPVLCEGVLAAPEPVAEETLSTGAAASVIVVTGAAIWVRVAELPLGAGSVVPLVLLAATTPSTALPEPALRFTPRSEPARTEPVEAAVLPDERAGVLAEAAAN